jgi:hypothetical protein
MEKMTKDTEEQFRTEMERVIKYFTAQLEEEKRKYFDEQVRLMESVCKAYRELEEIKVSVASLHMTVQYYQLLLLPTTNHLSESSVTLPDILRQIWKLF